jgi:hypothetical protein
MTAPDRDHRLTRRAMLGGLPLALLALAGVTGLGTHPAAARQDGWIEVVGAATVAGPADHDAARRRALADALLAAALAGGAQVRGHSAMAMARITSDLLIVRPTGRILAHRILSQDFDGRMWQVRIAARVGQPQIGQCPDRRRLLLAMAAPRVEVSPNAPAWADVLGRDLAHHLMVMAQDHPAVVQLTRAAAGAGAGAGSGTHDLTVDLRLAPESRDLVLNMRLRLEGPGLDRIEGDHTARLRLPGPSVLGRAAPLIQPDRQAMAAELFTGVRAALTGFLDRAACQPAQARLVLAQGHLTVPLGRAHGLSQASLAFTADPDISTQILEVRHLSDRSAILAPLDPTVSPTLLQSRAVRFMDMTERLP